MDEDLSTAYVSAMKQIASEQEAYWNSLSKEDQLKVFCSVIRRLYQGELVDKGTYRHVLYSVFGFGKESYAQAQEAGFLAVHNAIVDENYDGNLLRAFCVKNGIDDIEKRVLDFIL